MTVMTTADQPADATSPAAAIPPAGSGTPAEAATTDTLAPAEIARLRARIDEIDDTMIALWRERADLSQQIGAVRVASGGTRLALAREREILDRFRQELGAIGTQLGLLILRAGRGPL